MKAAAKNPEPSLIRDEKPSGRAKGGEGARRLSAPAHPPAAGRRKGKTTVFFLVNLPDLVREVIFETAASSFPDAQICPLQTVTEAARQSLSGQRQLLVLADKNDEEVSQATQATDRQDMPPWAVVILGRNQTSVAESVSMDECTPSVLARVFRSALLQHELLRENLQLRGDVKTLAHRLRHDLAGPLHCIQLNCDLMGEILDDDSPVKMQIGLARKSLKEMYWLIDRVDQIFRASAEAPAKTPVHMDQVIDNVLHHLKGDLEQHGAMVTQPARWPRVDGVASWLDVIWRNLIINALKHGFPAEPIELNWIENADGVRFEVTNRGPAVPVELGSEIFLPFDQLHNQRGRGFGLCVVHRLVTLQDGICGYERNDADSSSLFFFTLPAPPRSTF